MEGTYGYTLRLPRHPTSHLPIMEGEDVVSETDCPGVVDRGGGQGKVDPGGGVSDATESDPLSVTYRHPTQLLDWGRDNVKVCPYPRPSDLPEAVVSTPTRRRWDWRSVSWDLLVIGGRR